MSRTVALVLGALLLLVGVIWTTQGLGYLGGSPMTGKTLWAIVGPVVALIGIVLVARGGRARPGG
jgi:hypothetical protein